MQRLLIAVPLAVLAGCGPAVKMCAETGCAAGSICNSRTGVCEISSASGGGEATAGGGGSPVGGGGSTGGGSAGGGGSTGGGGHSSDAGVDGGKTIDPFDDGGVFVPGDICTYAIPVLFDGGASDGGPPKVTLRVNLATAQNQYRASCNSSLGSGKDLLFELTLAEPKGVIISANDTTNGRQDAVISLVTSPCASFNQAACIDTTNDPEVLYFDRLPAGTYYVLLENFGVNVTDGAYEVQFELLDPVPAPPNDSCGGAEDLVFTSGVATAMGTTVGAFNDSAGSPLTCSSASATSPEVYYRFTLAQPQDVHVRVDVPTGSNLAPAVALTDACGAGGMGTTRGCTTATGAPFIAKRIPAGTYYLVVDGNTASTGPFWFEVALAPPTPLPTNDTCATPAPLGSGVRQTVDTNEFNRDYSFSCATGLSGGDVVYQFTITLPQKVTINAAGRAGADAVVSLRGAPCATSSQEIACADDSTWLPEVLTEWNLPAGTYYVVLGARSTSQSLFDLELTVEPPFPPPTNETCSAPATLTPHVSQNVDLGPAMLDYDFGCAFVSGGDAVYQFTTTMAQRVVVTATGVGRADAVLALRGPPCDTSMNITCVNDTEEGEVETLEYNNLPAGTYYVLLASDGLDARFGIQLTLEPPRLPPTNESCSAPEVVTLTAGMASSTVDLGQAMADLPSDLCGTTAIGQDVVYQVVLPGMSELTVVATPTSPALDTVMFARSPLCAMAASEVCVDDTADGDEETLTVANSTPSPKTVFIMVKAYDVTRSAELSLTFTVN